ncbi:ATP-binding protein [Streptomyces olivochromogenes]|uniref:ATP-binding protein n=1 Tax=Streptomyces olivochromogenes TaxID=1963 RepID=UPI00313431D9
MNEPVEAADDKQLGKTRARCGRVGLIELDELDELDYLERDRRGAERLFQLLAEREGKSSITVASNEAFTGRSRTLTDARLCTAIVDWPTFSATLIETGTESSRLARSEADQTKQSSRPGSPRQRPCPQYVSVADFRRPERPPRRQFTTTKSSSSRR